MEKYTLQSLKEINVSYDFKHSVTQSDVDKVNKMVEMIEKSRNKESVQVGDIVEFTNKYGDYYRHAHVESNKDMKLYICEKPYVPFIEVRRDTDTLYTSTSGGAWRYIPENLQYVGTKEKAFVVWGHRGPCGNGAVTFFANVNVWEYTEGTPTFSTKNYDKFHVSIREKSYPNDYKYIITKGGTSHTAFQTDEEYQAWLKTYHGVEEEGNWPNTKFVWTYKQESKCIPLEDYLNLNDAMIDSELCNGSIQECKRVYEGTSVKTFLPHQNGIIKLTGGKQYMQAYKNLSKLD